MKKIKGLIFDFDGLILDTEEPSFKAWSQIYRDHGLELDVQAWSGTLGSSEDSFNPVAHLEGILNSKMDENLLRHTARINTNREILEKQPLPGVAATLEKARQMGLKLGVASSSPRSWVVGHLKRLGLISYFQAILCMEDVPHVKPSPDLFEAALFQLGLKPQEVIVFEDSPNGITAAQRAKIFSVAIPNSVSGQLDLSQANLILTRMDAVPFENLLETAEASMMAS